MLKFEIAFRTQLDQVSKFMHKCIIQIVEKHWQHTQCPSKLGSGFFYSQIRFCFVFIYCSCASRGYSVRRRKEKQNPTLKLKYNKLSKEKYHNMERELKNIVLIFIYMYYLKPSENMFEVKWNFKTYYHAARDIIIKFLNAKTYFCIIVVVLLLLLSHSIYLKSLYSLTEFLVYRKLVLFLSPNFFIFSPNSWEWKRSNFIIFNGRSNALTCALKFRPLCNWLIRRFGNHTNRRKKMWISYFSI